MRSDVKVLTGKVYGHLTVLDQVRREGKKTEWLCRCDCEASNEVWAASDSLNSGQRNSCGCTNKGWAKTKDRTGDKSGRLTVLRQAPREGKKILWVCVCDCTPDKELIFPSTSLSSKVQSCGCLQREKASIQGRITGPANATHNASETPEWLAWRNMRTRCYVETSDSYKHYGAMGVTVCPEWREDFVPFLQYLGLRPSKEYSIDRIDPHGNYEPGNVKWSTHKEQQRNRRKHRLVEFDNRVQCLAAWADEYHISYQMLWRRYVVDKIDFGTALTAPAAPRGKRHIKKRQRV